MIGFVRTNDKSRLTRAQHLAVLALVRWYLANPCAVDDVEMDRLVKVESKLALNPLVQTGSFVRSVDGARLTLRQHRSLVALVRWSTQTDRHQVNRERLSRAEPKLSAVLALSTLSNRRKASTVAKNSRKPESYWQKRLDAARYLKRRKHDRIFRGSEQRKESR